MTHKTNGIVLKTVKYGETSLVVTMFTELFGVQTYMVNGVRSSKQSLAKANFFQPSSMLEMVVYHHQQKNMQRMKEFKWSYIYTDVQAHVVKNSVALYMVELLYKCLKQPEANADLYYFCEDAFKQLDKANKTVTANFPLFFALHLCHFFGMKMSDDYTPENCFLDLREGVFINHQPLHPDFLSNQAAELTAWFLKAMHPDELVQFKLHPAIRRQLLLYYQHYYALHIQDFGQMKTLHVLQEVLA